MDPLEPRLAVDFARREYFRGQGRAYRSHTVAPTMQVVYRCPHLRATHFDCWRPSPRAIAEARRMARANIQYQPATRELLPRCASPPPPRPPSPSPPVIGTAQAGGSVCRREHTHAWLVAAQCGANTHVPNAPQTTETTGHRRRGL
jgi:hypothetical protein